MSRAQFREKLTNAVLIGLAVALAIVVFATRKSVTTSEAELRTTNMLAVYHEYEITRIQLERKGDPFTLVRTKTDDAGIGTWQLTQPRVEDADPFAVEKLLGTLEFASFVRRIKPEEVNRAAFGLDDPEWVVHVDMGDVKYRLRVGREAASPKGAHYVEVAGENAPSKGVVLAEKSLLDELSVKIEDFRDRYVMPYLSTQLDRIVLEGDGGTRKLKRATWRDGWRFDGMLGDARLGRVALDRVLAEFAHTRAEKFIDPAAAEKTLAGTPTVTVTMVPTDKKSPTGVVIVGGKCEGSDTDVVAIRKAPDATAACVPRGVLSGLSTPADVLFDRTLFWQRPDEVESLEIQRGDQKLSLDRKDMGFIMRAPREAPVDAEAGNARLKALLQATGAVVESPDRAKLGLEPPSGHATVKSAAADDSLVQEETITESAPDAAGKVYVARQADGVVLELDREAARALVADSSLVRDRKILDFPISDVAGVEIDGEVHQVLERTESGALTLKTPAGFGADGAQSLEVFDALRTLTAERWVADRDDGTFGLERPRVTAKLSIRNKGAVDAHTLHLGRAVSAGYFASMEGDPGVFVVPRLLFDVLNTLVIDRGAFVMDLSATSKVTLETHERKVVLEKRGDEFIETDDGEPLSGDAIQKIVDTLSSLRAEAAIAIGAPKPDYGLDRPVLTVRIDKTPGIAGAKNKVFEVGAGDSWRGLSIHYARVEGAEATYVIARSAVNAVLELL